MAAKHRRRTKPKKRKLPKNVRELRPGFTEMSRLLSTLQSSMRDKYDKMTPEQRAKIREQNRKEEEAAVREFESVPLSERNRELDEWMRKTYPERYKKKSKKRKSRKKRAK